MGPIRRFYQFYEGLLMTPIGWVSELIGIAGVEDIFPERAAEPGARERVIENPKDVVITRQPDIIIGC
ncbi:hypothetical protein [Marinobacter alexandrii]|uniref:hypothetical protein n=1 Tax=Marinobacter alexandrii TaxID=2570351 RepID=UPI0032649FD0